MAIEVTSNLAQAPVLPIAQTVSLVDANGVAMANLSDAVGLTGYTTGINCFLATRVIIEVWDQSVSSTTVTPGTLTAEGKSRPELTTWMANNNFNNILVSTGQTGNHSRATPWRVYITPALTGTLVAGARFSIDQVRLKFVMASPAAAHTWEPAFRVWVMYD